MEDKRYTVTAVYLHWGVAAIMVAMVWLGVYMANLPPTPEKFILYDAHKSIGVIAFLLVVFRLFWRLNHPAPVLPEAYSPLLRRASHVLHLLIYVLMIGVPVSGWIMSAAHGHPATLFGLVLPVPIEKNQLIAESVTGIHFALSLALAVLVIGHTLIALKHHFIDKDGLLGRMGIGRM
ncbi:cytochrome b [Rhodopseudomonas palustris]|uniref:cytochrome b n=1 Tax=Rhodopseudomonas palustris TaxID=1076 RepID=UPI002ACD2B40|nr:cytochrome b [Rhodopseudomonas palustris]WQH00871.1 cytochrome b [Rhodopseudomonas palustris]